jgi:redox-sensitive bicupin YhaK (pirin superfamily)
MIALRRNDARHYVRKGKVACWQTFNSREPPGRTDQGLGTLANIEELRIAPRGGTEPRPRSESEVLTYVYQGALVRTNDDGSSDTLQAGEFQRMSSGPCDCPQETNASATNGVHFFQLSLHAQSGDLESGREQRRFTSAHRRNRLCLVGSSDGRQGSLRMARDVLILSSKLDPGHHLIHELRPDRSAWVHIVHGEATLGDLLLVQGDGVGVTGESSVSLTAGVDTELLLIDVRSPRPARDGQQS